jgi:hypothetical protein
MLRPESLSNPPVEELGVEAEGGTRPGKPIRCPISRATMIFR